VDWVCVATAAPAKFSQMNSKWTKRENLISQKPQDKLRASPSTSSSPSISRIDRPRNELPLTVIPLLELSWQTMVMSPVSATTLQTGVVYQNKWQLR
jgi:hypothetical protein